jgi:GNAT superfamily N-acetyltransferase
VHPGFLVRSARLSDVGSIVDIAVASARDMAPGFTYAEHAARNRQRLASTGKSDTEQLIERSARSPELQRAYVAILGSMATRREDVVIGYGFARRTGPDDYLDAEHVLLHGAAVDKDHQRMGVAKGLLSAVCGWSQGMALPLCAQVADTNIPMLRTLEGKGFIQSDTYRPGGGNPVTYRVMVRPSDGAALTLAHGIAATGEQMPHTTS